jgi:hypothetical protein
MDAGNATQLHAPSQTCPELVKGWEGESAPSHSGRVGVRLIESL